MIDQGAGAIVSQIVRGGVADQLGITPGDRIMAINDQPIEDLIDLLLLTAQDEIRVIWESEGERYKSESLANVAQRGLGLQFESAVFNGIKHCRNKCMFCFVDQEPRGLRRTLYIKDDDYRLSFLQGAYITLSNLSEEDWQRILTLRLSPMYVSVHAVNPEIRGRLLGLPGPAPIMPALRRLLDHHIEVHCQIVVCRGINDGVVLQESISELARYTPGIASLAIVPVGLTCHREGLPALQAFEKDSAHAVLEIIHDLQEKFFRELGTRFVFAADEWYIKADVPFPADEEYEEYPQISNGVGLARRFLTDLAESSAMMPQTMNKETRLWLITGLSSAAILREAAARLNQIEKLQVQVLPVENAFFGKTVTVTGLLTGSDISRALTVADIDAHDIVFIPDIALRSSETVFLDDTQIEDLKKTGHANIIVVPSCVSGLIDAVNSLNGGHNNV